MILIFFLFMFAFCVSVMFKHRLHHSCLEFFAVDVSLVLLFVPSLLICVLAAVKQLSSYFGIRGDKQVVWHSINSRVQWSSHSGMAQECEACLWGGACLSNVINRLYSHLNKKQRIDIDHVKQALITTFVTDSFVAFNSFIMRQLLPSETMDVFLAELGRLTLLVGDVLPEKWMICAFVAGLPSYMRQHLRASTGMDDIILELILTRSQAIMSDGKELVAADVQLVQFIPCTANNHSITGYKCSGLNHFARECQFQCGKGCSDSICKVYWRYAAAGAER